MIRNENVQKGKNDMKKQIFTGIFLVLFSLFLLLYLQYCNDIQQAYQRVINGSHLLVTENGRIEYGLSGEGTPALVIHGAGGGYDQGLLMGQAFLGGGYQYIAVSRFGYLGSPLPEEATLETQGKLYADLLDHLGIEKVIVLGVSAGGPSAAQFVHDYPQRSNALILVSAVSMYMGEKIPLSTKIVNRIQKSDFSYWLVLKIFRTQFLELIGIPQETYHLLNPVQREFTDGMLEFMHPMSPRLPGNLHEAKIIPLSAEELSIISCSTIIIHALDDTLVSFDHGKFYHDHIPNAELVSFPAGGHGLASELEEIQKRIKMFLDRNKVKVKEAPFFKDIKLEDV